MKRSGGNGPDEPHDRNPQGPVGERRSATRRGLLPRLNQIAHLALHAPFNRRIIQHAAALSFTFLLSLIPMLAMIFSVAKAFGIQEKIEPLLLEKTLGGEIAADLIPKIIEYVDNTNVGALGSIGLLFIFYTSISLLGQIEQSFNGIWGVRQPRTLIRKASDYLSLLILSPLLLGVTVGLTTSLQSHALMQKLLAIGLFAGAMKIFFHCVPWLTSILALTLLYMIIPNTTVRFFPALLSGTLSGIAWQLSQTFFITFQFGVARYNAIYGTFATVPIFMIWLQVSWVIILFGGVISFACQHAGRQHTFASPAELSCALKEKIALGLFLAISAAYARKAGGSSPEQLGNRLGLADHLVASGIKLLRDNRLILALEDSQTERYVPMAPPESMIPADLFRHLAGSDGASITLQDQEIDAAVTHILARRDQVLVQGFSQATLLRFLEQHKEASFSPPVSE